MRSEALDITIESRKDTIWIVLSGPFHNEQVPNIREKIEGLIEDGNRQMVLDMELVTEVGDAAVPMLLNELSLVRGKGGEIRMIFKNPIVTTAFAAYRNIFRIYPDSGSLARGGWLGAFKYRRWQLSRKTGVRLSRPVALVLLVVLGGWFISLGFIIMLQHGRIRDQQRDVQELTQWKQQTLLELQSLRERLLPLEQLGIIPDTAADSIP